MSCCPFTETPFVSTASTTIPYDGTYGTIPNVQVLYEVDGVWYNMGVLTSIQLIGAPGPITSIVVDHGGVATGVVKVY